MLHHANGRFDWLISERQSVNSSREAASILSGKYRKFTLVHPVNIRHKLIEFWYLHDVKKQCNTSKAGFC